LGILVGITREKMKVQNRPKPDLRAIGMRIRSLRANTKQVKFAYELGISQAQLSKIERGDVAPTLELLVLLSSKFKKTVDWITHGNT
jgi:transcriptional regulator with XRE-family HTH domain